MTLNNVMMALAPYLLLHKSTNVLKSGLCRSVKEMHVLEEVKYTTVAHLAPYKVLNVLFNKISTCRSLIGWDSEPCNFSLGSDKTSKFMNTFQFCTRGYPNLALHYLAAT